MHKPSLEWTVISTHMPAGWFMMSDLKVHRRSDRTNQDNVHISGKDARWLCCTRRRKKQIEVTDLSDVFLKK